MATSGRAIPSAAFFDELDRFVDSEPVGWTERPSRRPVAETLGDTELPRAPEPGFELDRELPLSDEVEEAADAAFSRAPALTRREAFAQRLSEELDRPPPPPPPAPPPPATTAPAEPRAQAAPTQAAPSQAAPPAPAPSAAATSAPAPSAAAPAAPAPSAVPKGEDVPRPSLQRRSLATPVAPGAVAASRPKGDPLGAVRPGAEQRAAPVPRAADEGVRGAVRVPAPPSEAVPPHAMPPAIAAHKTPPQAPPPELVDDDFIDDDAPADALEWELDNAISAIIANRNGGSTEPAAAPSAPPPAPPVAREVTPEPVDTAPTPPVAMEPDEPLTRAAVGTKRPRPVPSFQFERRQETEEVAGPPPADYDNPLSNIFFNDVRANFDAVHAGSAQTFEEDPGFQLEDLGPDGLDDEYPIAAQDEDQLPPSLSRAARRRRAGRRTAGLATLAGVAVAVLVVVVIGVKVFAGNGDTGATAPVIHANARNVKVMADTSGSDAEPDIVERTRLGETEELVLPDRVEIGRAPTITLESEDDAILARRVSTMKVRPDGTIVPAGAGGANPPARVVSTGPASDAADAAEAPDAPANELSTPTRSSALTPYDVAAVAPSNGGERSVAGGPGGRGRPGALRGTPSR